MPGAQHYNKGCCQLLVGAAILSSWAGEAPASVSSKLGGEGDGGGGGGLGGGPGVGALSMLYHRPAVKLLTWLNKTKQMRFSMSCSARPAELLSWT